MRGAANPTPTQMPSSDNDYIPTALKGRDIPPAGLLGLIYDLMSDGVLVYDSSAIVMFANPAMSLILGLPNEKIVGRKIDDLLTDDTGSTSYAGGSTTTEMKITRPDGKVRFINCKSFGLTSSPPLQVGICRDITRRKKAQVELATNERRLKSIVNGLPTPVIIWNSRDGAIQYANPKAEEFFGLPDAELTQCKLEKFFVDSHVFTGFQVAVERMGTLEDFECAFRRPDGREIMGLLSCRPFGADASSGQILVAILDTTERHRRVEELREMASLYRRAIAAAGAVAYQLHVPSGRYLFIGPEIERLIGVKPEELTPERWAEMCVEVVIGTETKGMTSDEARRRMRATGNKVWRADVCLRLAGGEERWLADYSIPVPEPDGTVRARLGILQDLTERKATEHALRDRDERLKQGEKLEAMGRLAAAISHDFNNLLTGIAGFAEMAAQDPQISPATRENIGEVLHTVSRGATLVRQIIDTARARPEVGGAVRPQQLMLGLERLLPRLLGDHIRLTVSVSEMIDDAWANESQLEQILINLAINARDAMPEGGRLAIEVENFRRTAQHATRWPGISSGEYVLFRVSDTGTGIAPEHLPRLFDPFFTTKDPGRGTGIGLATVQSMAQRAGGGVRIDTEVGVGTVVEVMVPNARGRLAVAATASRPAGIESVPMPPPLARATTVLLVEDDEVVLQVALKVLTARGYDVLAVGSAEEALEMFRKRGGVAIDLLLTDIILPAMSGVELYRELATQIPGLRVVLMTGYPQMIDSSVGQTWGGRPPSVIEKPFTASQLVNAVAEALV